MLGRVAITPALIASTDAAALIARLDMELEDRYPSLDNSHSELTSEEVEAGRGVFLIAKIGSDPVGCGAVCRVDQSIGEIRRMYVLPSARGARVGRRLLAELERHARENGLERLILVTGIRQPEAICLYERSGYTRIPCPPDYTDSPLRVFMEKRPECLQTRPVLDTA